MGDRKLIILLRIFLSLLIILKFSYLLEIPVFSDEAYNLWWSDLVATDLTALKYPLADGQTPLVHLLFSRIIHITPEQINVLILARIFNLLVDLITASLLYLIVRWQYHDLSASLVSIAYLSLPMTQFYSRIFTLDIFASTLIALTLATVVVSIKLVTHKLYLVIAALLFFVPLLGYFTKPITILSLIAIATLPFTLFIFRQINVKQLTRITLPYFSSLAIIAIVHYQFAQLDRHVNYQLSVQEYKFNLFRTYLWLKTYFTLPIIILTTLSALHAIYQKQYALVLTSLVWIGIILVTSPLLAAHYYPRHLYALSIPVSLLLGYYLTTLIVRNSTNKWSMYIVGLIFIYIFFQDFLMISNPTRYIAGADRQQLFEDWSSGYGLDQVADYLQVISQTEPITVYVDGLALTNWALPKLYDIGNTTIIHEPKLQYPDSMVFFEPIPKNTYVLLNYQPAAPEHWPQSLAASISKTENRTLNVYKLNSQTAK